MKTPKIPSFLKNFYLISGGIFLIWMLFLDANDFITQYQRQSRLKKLEKEKKYYQQEMQKIEKGYRDLLEKPSVLEKFAREKYLMKKPEEDVYIIVEKEPSGESKE